MATLRPLQPGAGVTPSTIVIGGTGRANRHNGYGALVGVAGAPVTAAGGVRPLYRAGPAARTGRRDAQGQGRATMTSD